MIVGARRNEEARPAPGLTVDALARAAGTTSRQVRALQTRGLLPHPHLVGRTGHYGPEHLDRLRAVLRLQRDGFSLSAVAALLRAWESGRTLAEVLGLPEGPGQAADGEGPRRPRRPDEVDEAEVLDTYAVPRRIRLLSVVPTTVVDAPRFEAPVAS